MNLTKSTIRLLTLIVMATLFYSCSNDDDCTELALVKHETTDSFGNVTPAKYQEVPCGFGDPVDEPVGLHK